MVTVDHKRRKGLGPKQSLVFAAFADSSPKASSIDSLLEWSKLGS